MLRVERVVGSQLEPEIAAKLHALEHRRAVDILVLAAADVARRRMRATTANGLDLAISLPRDHRLYDGAVLLLEHDRAIVVRVGAERWLRLRPHSISDAIELGYHAGNLHWRVRFDGAALLVAQQAPLEDYVARLGPLIENDRVSVSAEPPPETA